MANNERNYQTKSIKLLPLFVTGAMMEAKAGATGNYQRV